MYIAKFMPQTACFKWIYSSNPFPTQTWEDWVLFHKEISGDWNRFWIAHEIGQCSEAQHENFHVMNFLIAGMDGYFCILRHVC